MCIALLSAAIYAHKLLECDSGEGQGSFGTAAESAQPRATHCLASIANSCTIQMAPTQLLLDLEKAVACISLRLGQPPDSQVAGMWPMCFCTGQLASMLDCTYVQQALASTTDQMACTHQQLFSQCRPNNRGKRSKHRWQWLYVRAPCVRQFK